MKMDDRTISGPAGGCCTSARARESARSRFFESWRLCGTETEDAWTLWASAAVGVCLVVCIELCILLVLTREIADNDLTWRTTKTPAATSRTGSRRRTSGIDYGIAEMEQPDAERKTSSTTAITTLRTFTDNHNIGHPVAWAFSQFDRGLQKVLPEKVHRVLKRVFDYLVKKWFFIGLASFIALSHSFPHATEGVEIDYWAVALIFFISGLSISTKELLLNMSNIHAHVSVLVMSFLITSAIVFGICCGIKAAHNGEISEWMLAGLIVTHTCPTTVSSNVVMTRQADGNVALCLCEVIIGNMLGAFVTPALSQMYLSGTWQFANPANGTSVSSVYRHVMMQIGLSVFVPMFVGQVVQNIIPKQVKWCLRFFMLNKVGTFCLLLIMWSSFCTAFRQNAFTSVSHSSIIMICFFNLGIYLFFTLVCFFYARPWFVLKLFPHKPDENSFRVYRVNYWLFRPFFYSKKDTVTILLCGPAKTAALGVSLVTSQYGNNNPYLGQLLVPLVLYQAEQVFTAGILTSFMKKWVNKKKVTDEEEKEALAGKGSSVAAANGSIFSAADHSTISTDTAIGQNSDESDLQFSVLGQSLNDNVDDDGDLQDDDDTGDLDKGYGSHASSARNMNGASTSSGRSSLKV